jgi:hypothetical protein
MNEEAAYQVLGTSALGLLIIVTSGIIYLTLTRWRDRRRQDDDRRYKK